MTDGEIRTLIQFVQAPKKPIAYERYQTNTVSSMLSTPTSDRSSAVGVNPLHGLEAVHRLAIAQPPKR